MTETPISLAVEPSLRCSHQQHEDPFRLRNTSCSDSGADGNGHSREVRKLLVAIVLCFIFMLAELVGGYLSGSLAIMTDAAHLLSDVAGFLVSLCALSLSRRKASSIMSYGYHRAEILGALLSISLVWALTGWLVVEAIDRLRNPQHIDGKVMLIVAGLGVLVNGIIGLVLQPHHHRHEQQFSSPREPLLEEGACGQSRNTSDTVHYHPAEPSLNVRAAFIHAIGDLIQSVGVLIAAGLIWWRPSWHIADPLCTFLFSLLVLASTWMLARDTIVILMEGAPPGISHTLIKGQLGAIPGVQEVHDLHIWSLAPGKIAATVHIVIDWLAVHGERKEERLQSNQHGILQPTDCPVAYERILMRCQSIICAQGVHHVTIQVDPTSKWSPHCRVDCCGSVDNFLSNSKTGS